MNGIAVRSNRRKLVFMTVLMVLCAVGYLVVEVNFSNPNLVRYAMKLRAPKLLAMLITAFAIGGASLVFQSIINNTIVTPCLLGMNSLYTLIHTAVVFFIGSGSALAVNANLAFAVDVVLMGIVATLLYSYLFRKTNHNVLYVLLVGTVLTSFFGSIQTTLTRVMDPNEYDTLLTSLVAGFNNINNEITPIVPPMRPSMERWHNITVLIRQTAPAKKPLNRPSALTMQRTGWIRRRRSKMCWKSSGRNGYSLFLPAPSSIKTTMGVSLRTIKPGQKPFPCRRTAALPATVPIWLWMGSIPV